MKKPLTDISGQKFYKLTVVEFVESKLTVYVKTGRKRWVYMYRCKCDCGGERIVNAEYLKKRMAKGCSECTLVGSKPVYRSYL